MAPLYGPIKKYYYPLESNPHVFTQLSHTLGLSKKLEFQDVYSIDDQDLLAFVMRPVLALVLVFPPSEEFDYSFAKQEAEREFYTGKGENEDVLWFRQTIGNACGLYAMLHGVLNGEARNYIEPSTPLSRLATTATPLGPEERALALEASEEIEKACLYAGTSGDSDVPYSAEASVPYHYTCFVKSSKNGHLYQMVGNCKGPIDIGPVLAEEEDLLAEGALNVIREFTRREEGRNIGFSLLALVPTSGNE